MASITFWASICGGRGSCTRMPSTAGSALSRGHQPSSSASLVGGRQHVLEGAHARPRRSGGPCSSRRSGSPDPRPRSRRRAPASTPWRARSRHRLGDAGAQARRVGFSVDDRGAHGVLSCQRRRAARPGPGASPAITNVFSRAVAPASSLTAEAGSRKGPGQKAPDAPRWPPRPPARPGPEPSGPAGRPTASRPRRSRPARPAASRGPGPRARPGAAAPGQGRRVLRRPSAADNRRSASG